MTAMCRPTRNDGRVVQRFDPELTELQRKLLALLGISAKGFMNA
jgi:hypothetical protein